MIPFGRCLLLWRLKKGLSQGALAAKAGLPRPNLSDIERGKRDVSLRTLRALALGLGVSPGVLADGIGPDPAPPQPLSREKLERIAEAAAHGKELPDPVERDLAGKMALLLRSQLGTKGFRSRGSLEAQRAWLSLTAVYPGEEIESLRKRVLEKGGIGRSR